MKRQKWQAAGAGLILALASIASAQGATAGAPPQARIGSLEYVEGDVFVSGKTVTGSADQLPVLSEGASLRTGNKGHAEMLLTPGVFVRLDRESELQLVSASLTDTRIALRRGSAIVEVNDLHKDNAIRIQTGAQQALVLKAGLYRFYAPPAMARVEVQQGQIATTEGDRTLKVGKNHAVISDGFVVEKTKAAPVAADDDLARWSRLRSEYEAEASISSAQYAFDAGVPWGYSDWFWNPWFSSWTWFPAGGLWTNPYGFGFWSPLVVYDYFPARYYGYRHHYAFTGHPANMRVSASGLNLQRGAAVQGPAQWRPCRTRSPRQQFHGHEFDAVVRRLRRIRRRPWIRRRRSRRRWRSPLTLLELERHVN